MRRLSFLALGATALCAVAFSPGLEVLLAVTVIVLLVIGVTMIVDSPPTWLKTLLTFLSLSIDVLTGHVHLRAGGLGAGGRHGPPSIIFLFLLAVWAIVLTIWSRTGHAVMNLGTSAGHIMARTNTSAQPLPS